MIQRVLIESVALAGWLVASVGFYLRFGLWAACIFGGCTGMALALIAARNLNVSDNADQG